MEKGKYKFFLWFLVILLIAVNYNYVDNFVTKNFSYEEFVSVDKVIDGDTVVVNGTSVRLLGINTPERGEKYYAEAKNYTEDLVLNKTLKIERKGKDLYDRDLAYLFYGRENINLALVEEGYANFYFPSGKDNYYNLFVNAWEKCIGQNKNLCEASSDKCSECIILEQFGYDVNLILYNSCDFDCNLTGWSIKDEGRKKFVFKNIILNPGKEIEITAKNFNQSYVWTKTGDSVFLRDDEGKLVLWEGY